MANITGITNNPSQIHNTDDRRRFVRRSTAIRVQIAHPSFGIIVGFAQDISDGGTLVKIDNSPLPPVGTEVNVRFIKMAGAVNQDPVKMKVMHHQSNTIGLMFCR